MERNVKVDETKTETEDLERRTGTGRSSGAEPFPTLSKRGRRMGESAPFDLRHPNVTGC